MTPSLSKKIPQETAKLVLKQVFKALKNHFHVLGYNVHSFFI